ncbi:MAG: ATPase, partial [Bacteroides sp.]|nr:ATPase [Bacteroides sp.]
MIDTQTMNSPFKYGKIVTGKSFINRVQDIKRIQNNIAAGINTILISPRRWGKSSLIKQLAYQNSDKKLRFAFIDFFNIRTEQDFLEKYSREVIKCSITRKEELLQSGRDLFQ